MEEVITICAGFAGNLEIALRIANLARTNKTTEIVAFFVGEADDSEKVNTTVVKAVVDVLSRTKMRITTEFFGVITITLKGTLVMEAHLLLFNQRFRSAYLICRHKIIKIKRFLNETEKQNQVAPMDSCQRSSSNRQSQNMRWPSLVKL